MGRCARCIAVSAKCELFVPKEEWKKVEKEKRKKRLAIARLKAELASKKVELLEVESCK